MTIKEGDYFYLKSYEELENADKRIFNHDWYKSYFGKKLKVNQIGHDYNGTTVVGCQENSFEYYLDWIKKATKQIELDFED